MITSYKKEKKGKKHINVKSSYTINELLSKFELSRTDVGRIKEAATWKEQHVVLEIWVCEG